ncbi:hypothetical protein GCWU000325_00249 [Alloprevotella tannerae ATCC 51259]|uniref:Uncharacterized protein n=1 Tax=Alloprevotella tannerae ATCC 51259 TaxID=626522 RepID=C9LDH9_9BACT|nr:hypothetical protein GCWU000325_00249 [Alloprevotella tannerae ATCC 51259]
MRSFYPFESLFSSCFHIPDSTSLRINFSKGHDRPQANKRPIRITIINS